jgi:hypothetical protein
MLSSADPTTRSLDLELDPSPQVSSRSFFALSALSPKGDIAIDSFQIHRLREMQRMKKPPRRKLAVSLLKTGCFSWKPIRQSRSLVHKCDRAL